MTPAEAQAAQVRAAVLVRELAGLLAYRGTAAHARAQEQLREIREQPELAGASRAAAEQEVSLWLTRESSMEFSQRARVFYARYHAAPATEVATAAEVATTAEVATATSAAEVASAAATPASPATTAPASTAASTAFAPSFTEVRREFALAELTQVLEAQNLPLNPQLGEQVLLAVADFVDECAASTLQSLRDLNSADGVRHIWTEANRSLIEGVVAHISAELEHLGAAARAGLSAVRGVDDTRDLVFRLIYEYAELDKAVRTARKNLAELRRLLHAVWQYAAGMLAGLAIEAPLASTIGSANAAAAAFAVKAANKAASAAAAARAKAEAEVLAAMITSVEFDPDRVIADAARAQDVHGATGKTSRKPRH